MIDHTTHLNKSKFVLTNIDMANPHQIVGTSPSPKEGAAKVPGRAFYTQHHSPQHVVRSHDPQHHPYDHITSITFDPAIPWHETALGQTSYSTASQYYVT